MIVAYVFYAGLNRLAGSIFLRFLRIQMGLGKTIQVIALIAHLLTMGVSGPFLVVAPLATLPNWVREFEKWLPTQPVVRYHGTGEERERLMRNELNPKEKRSKTFPFIITSFETAIRDQNKLAKLSEYTYVIVDEGHRLKNHRCMLIRSLKQLKAKNRLLLTGTPIQSKFIQHKRYYLVSDNRRAFGTYWLSSCSNCRYPGRTMESIKFRQSCYFRRLVCIPVMVWIQGHWSEESRWNW